MGAYSAVLSGESAIATKPSPASTSREANTTSSSSSAATSSQSGSSTRQIPLKPTPRR